MRSQVLPIGVDLGSDSIKMLQLEVSGGALGVHRAARRQMPEETRTQPHLRMPVAMDLIRQMLRQEGFCGRGVVTAIPREIIHVKHLRLPMIPPAELEAAVQFEARSVFPFDTDEARVQHLHAGEVRQGNDTRQEVIVLAVRHEDVNLLLEQLHRTGCEVESLDFEPCAIYRGIERFIRRREDEQEVYVLVDVGARRTQVIIGRGREMSFFKSIEIGGMALHEAVSRKLEISLEEARELRRRIAAGTPDTVAGHDPVRQAVCDATRSIMQEMAREISLCLRYHSVTFRGHRPNKLRLIGGEAADPQLQAIVSAALPIPVEPARPLFSVETSRMQESDRRERMGQWAVAFGLSLKLTRDYFGARDGRQRSENVPGTAAAQGGVEVIDLARALGETGGADARGASTSRNGEAREETVHA